MAVSDIVAVEDRADSLRCWPCGLMAVARHGLWPQTQFGVVMVLMASTAVVQGVVACALPRKAATWFVTVADIMVVKDCAGCLG